MAKADRPNPEDILYRYARVTEDGADESKRTLQVLFASETPVLRTARKSDEKMGVAKEGEKYWEVLSCRAAHADMSILNDTGAFLDEHDPKSQLGKVNHAEVSTDGVCRAAVELDGESEISKVRYNQLLRGSRPHISTGYVHTGVVEKRGGAQGLPEVVFTWQSDEISSVYAPADPKARVARSAEQAQMFHCTRCGELFGRSDMDADFRCADCGPVARHLLTEKFVRSGATISAFDLAYKVQQAAMSNPHYVGKLDANGRTSNYVSVRDLQHDGKNWTAILHSHMDGKTHRVDVETDDKGECSLGDCEEGTMEQQFQPSERSRIDSDKLTSGEQILRRKNMDTPVLDEKVIRANERETVTASVTAEVTKQTRSKVTGDLLTRNKELVARGEKFVTDHGMKAGGKLGTVLRGKINEYVTKDHGAADDETIFLRFGQDCLGEISKDEYQPKPYRMEDEMSSRQRGQYSLARALAKMAERNEDHSMPKDGFELEIHQEVCKRGKENGGILGSHGNGAGGFWVPMDAPTPIMGTSSERRSRAARSTGGNRFQRDMTVSDFGAGGALVPPDYFLPVIEPLRNWTALDKVNIKFMGGLSGNVVIPRQTGVTAPQALSEIGPVAASQPAFDQITAVPRRTSNQTIWSRQLVLQSLPSIEQIIRDDNFYQMALQLDEWGINGQGGAQPVGVMNQPGVFAIVFGGTPTIAQLEQMATNIRASNIRKPMAYLTTSNARGNLRSVAAALKNSTTVISGQQNAIWTGTDEEGMVCGRPAHDSQQIPGDRMICGAWDEEIWFQWAGVEIVYDPYTAAGTGEIKLTFNTYNDFNVRHPQGFTISVDSANQ